MTKKRLAAALAIAATGWMAGLGGCAGNKGALSTDPMAEVRNERLDEPRRRAAIRQVWSQVEAGEIDRAAIREDLKTIAWSPAWPVSIRLAALEAVSSDRTEQGAGDTRNMVRLMLPRESQPEVTAFLSRLAAENGWTETTPALVRSLARPRWEVEDHRRPEYAAIAMLNPGRSVEEVAFGVFLSPPEGDARGVVTPERIRGDAWDLLARLDVDGTRRAALIMTGDGAASGGPLGEMHVLLNDMLTLPLTGEEIRWTRALRDFSDPVRRTWWTSTSSIVQQLDRERVGRLQMRHLEPIRWAWQHRSEWVSMEREQLLGEVRARLSGRQFHRRQTHRAELRPPPDRLSDWEHRLSWGDLLAVLVIDEAVRQPEVVKGFFEQSEQDRRDRSAEYGGLLRARAEGRDGLGGPAFGAVLYPPRQGNRRGDHEFVAPTDMIDQSYHALAHYHFHAQDERNSDFAGPSPGDLAYAARFGRSCLVLTSVGTGALNVDYYQPDGIVLDLGTLRR
jgi:hypothetical protein